MLSEFSLIERFFARRAASSAVSPTHAPRRRALLGIGDDCALIAPPAGEMLAVSTDMLVEGRHFLPDVDPHALGHKALAVNLSDLAAMGATPLGFTLALALPAPSTLPMPREAWLDAFSRGLFELAERFGCELIGGDTTAGPLNLCITVFGSVPPSQALRRDAAQPGDDVWVSGTLGDARAGLGVLRGEWRTLSGPPAPSVSPVPPAPPVPPAQSDALRRAYPGTKPVPPVLPVQPALVPPVPSVPPIEPGDAAAFRRALERPEPRIALGLALRGLAHAVIDLSDGLAGDLRHILERSRVSARIDVDALPRSAALARLPPDVQRQCALAGGDDYELCFTAARAQRAAIQAAAHQAGVAVARIGTICALTGSLPMNAPADPAEPLKPMEPIMEPALEPAAPTIAWHDASGAPLNLMLQGFDHFHAD